MIFLGITFGLAQEAENHYPGISDSITNYSQKEGITVVDTLKVKRKAISILGTK